MSGATCKTYTFTALPDATAARAGERVHLR